MTNWRFRRISIQLLLLQAELTAQGWEEITPPGFTGVTAFRSFEYQNGGFELFMWFSEFEPRQGLRLDESGKWETIAVYESLLCDSVNMEYSEYELLDVGKSSLSRNRTYSTYRRTGCITGSVVELHVDTTGAVSRQRLLLSYPFADAYGFGSVAVSAADSDLVFVRLLDDTLHVSTDGGETFVARLDPTSGGSGGGTFLSPFETNKVFVNDYDPISLESALYISTDIGMTWSVAPGVGDLSGIDFHPTNSSIAYGSAPVAIDLNDYITKTTNGGISWTGVLSGDSLGDPGTVRFHSVEVHKDRPDTVYVGSNLKIYYTTDAGISWRIYNDTFPLSPIIGIFQIPSTDTLIVVAQGGVFKVYDSFVLDVDNDENQLPMSFALRQNYPNPFNPVTIIKYDLPVGVNVILKVFDVIGNEVRTLVDGFEDTGYHKVTLDGSSLASGVYFYRLSAESFNDVKKMLIVK